MCDHSPANPSSPRGEALPAANAPIPADDTSGPATIRGRRPYVPLAPWLTGGFVLAALIAVGIPASGKVDQRDNRARCLSNAKQIALALTLFAGDNNGVYPQEGVPTNLHAPKTSNDAFAVIFPTYTQSETIFGNRSSTYQTRDPDNKIDQAYSGKPIETLAAGENVYAYVMGLTDASNAFCPLIADGTDGTGHYLTDPTMRGGVWEGREAIIIRLDNSGRFEPLAGPDGARYVPLGTALAETFDAKADDNLLDVKRFGEGVVLLEPAIAAP